jgi:hypothetical protein
MIIRPTALRLLTSTVFLLLASASLAYPVTNQLVAFTAPWHYTTNNVDGENWTSTGYDDSAWSGPSNGLLYIETASLPATKSTPLPAKPDGHPRSCYSFRTSFTITNTAQVVALEFRHLVDDGAVFYLNGAEIQRIRMIAGPVINSTQAYVAPPNGDATAIESFYVVGGLRTNLIEGVNVLAARVHQNGADSSDVVFGTQVSAVRDPAPVINLTRGPYLMVCTPSSIVIRWRTNLEENSLVRYGTRLDNMNMSCSDSKVATEHEVTLTHLAPDTLYYYSIGSDTRVLAGGDATCSFRTHPLSGQTKPLRIWVTGDPGTANSNEQAVLDAFETANGTHAVDAWVQLGDNAYNSGTDAEYQAALFDMCALRLRQTPIWSAIANHETYSIDWNGQYPYLNIYTMPTEGEAGGVASHTQLYYSFDIGMVHFISLDAKVSSRAPEGEMANWLRADLAATTNRWLIGFWHHPPYTKGSHNSDVEVELVEMRQNILPILEAGGVDLVLSAHSHSYERSYLLNGHYGLSTSLTNTMLLDSGLGTVTNGIGGYTKPETASGNPVPNQGTVYVVAGSSGKLGGGTLNHPAMPVSFNNLGSLVMDITTNRLSVVFLRETGATNDWFAISKANFAPVASNAVYRIEGDATTNILLGAGDVNRNVLSYALQSAPTNGLVTGLSASSGLLSYTPARGSTNSDSFRFAVSDGSLSSQPAAVTVHIQPSPDANSNGLPDAWETRYGVSDPAADPDKDGATNLQEYLAGTDPKNAQSWLRILPSAQTASGFRVTWSSVGGTRYRILYSNGTAAGGFSGTFTPLPRPVAEEMSPLPAGSLGTMAFTDDFTQIGAPPNGCRFYRISVIR